MLTLAVTVTWIVKFSGSLGTNPGQTWDLEGALHQKERNNKRTGLKKRHLKKSLALQ